MKRIILVLALTLFALPKANAQDIKLNGSVSAENNQIKNVADPTEAQDAATKNYTYSKTEVDALISNLQSQIGTLRGDPVDNEGNEYSYKSFGSDIWTTEPAAMVTYRDGTVIPEVQSNSEWAAQTKGAWCYYSNDNTTVKLYNWYAIMGIHDSASLTDPSLRKEFAPEGWQVPSNAQLIVLIDYLISEGYNFDNDNSSLNKVAKAMASTSGWRVSTTEGSPGYNPETNNDTGFNFYPHGYRTNSGLSGLRTRNGYLWTVDELGGGNAAALNLSHTSVSMGYASSPYTASYGKSFGFTVRFVKE